MKSSSRWSWKKPGRWAKSWFSSQMPNKTRVPRRGERFAVPGDSNLFGCTWLQKRREGKSTELNTASEIGEIRSLFIL